MFDPFVFVTQASGLFSPSILLGSQADPSVPLAMEKMMGDLQQLEFN